MTETEAKLRLAELEIIKLKEQREKLSEELTAISTELNELLKSI